MAMEIDQDAMSLDITPEGLEATLREKLDATHVDITDLSGAYPSDKIKPHHLTLSAGGCGQMLEAIIVSPHFVKKTTLARHRLVNGILKAEIAAIHAWTPKCFTPEEWGKKKGGG